jgi:hypothetical protein
MDRIKFIQNLKTSDFVITPQGGGIIHSIIEDIHCYVNVEVNGKLKSFKLSEIMPVNNDKMKELKIYEFQANKIEDTLRKVNNLLDCEKKETCLDRDVMEAMQILKNVLSELPNENSSNARF